MNVPHPFVPVGLCLAVLLSCAHPGPVPPKEEHGVRETIRNAEYYLSVCDFRKALDTLALGYSRSPGDDALRAGYVRTMERIRSTADGAYAKADYGNAGHMYFVLLRKMKQHADIARLLSFDRGYLGDRIRTSSKMLTEQGLVQYREGNLDAAIAIWERVVLFDPGNREVKKAIETATLQLKNLNELP